MDGIRRLGIVLREAPHFVNQHRIPLLGHKQTLADRVVGQPFKSLVTPLMDPQRQLLRLPGIEYLSVVINLDLEQPLLMFVGNHVGIGVNKLDCLGIAKPDQGNTPQNPAIQAQLHQFAFFVGHGKQAFTQRVVGQCRDIVLKPFNHLALQHGAILAQIDRCGVGLLP